MMPSCHCVRNFSLDRWRTLDRRAQQSAKATTGLSRTHPHPRTPSSSSDPRCTYLSAYASMCLCDFCMGSLASQFFGGTTLQGSRIWANQRASAEIEWHVFCVARSAQGPCSRCWCTLIPSASRQATSRTSTQKISMSAPVRTDATQASFVPIKGNIHVQLWPEQQPVEQACII